MKSFVMPFLLICFLFMALCFKKRKFNYYIIGLFLACFIFGFILVGNLLKNIEAIKAENIQISSFFEIFHYFPSVNIFFDIIILCAMTGILVYFIFRLLLLKGKKSRGNYGSQEKES